MDVPYLMGGEDEIWVTSTDIAGNMNSNIYEVPEPGTPFTVVSDVSPLGKFYYDPEGEADGGTEKPCVYSALPVKLSDLESRTAEYPLLMGLSYKVGRAIIDMAENSITVNTIIDMEENEKIRPEDYSAGEGRVTVYTHRPSVEELRMDSGKSYMLGEKIPVSGTDGGLIWIVIHQTITINDGEAVPEIDRYNFGYIPEEERGEKITKYREYLDYIDFQSF